MCLKLRDVKTTQRACRAAKGENTMMSRHGRWRGSEADETIDKMWDRAAR